MRRRRIHGVAANLEATSEQIPLLKSFEAKIITTSRIVVIVAQPSQPPHMGSLTGEPPREDKQQTEQERQDERKTLALIVYTMAVLMFAFEGTVLQGILASVGLTKTGNMGLLPSEESPYANDQTLPLTLAHGMVLAIPFWMLSIAGITTALVLTNMVLTNNRIHWLKNYAVSTFTIIILLATEFHLVGAQKLGVDHWSPETGMAGLSTMSIGSAAMFVSFYTSTLLVIHIGTRLVDCCGSKQK